MLYTGMPHPNMREILESLASNNVEECIVISDFHILICPVFSATDIPVNDDILERVNQYIQHNFEESAHLRYLYNLSLDNRILPILVRALGHIHDEQRDFGHAFRHITKVTWDAFHYFMTDREMGLVEKVAGEKGYRTPILPILKAAIDKDINLSECDFFQYKPDMEEDPFVDEPVMWAYYFFIFNDRLARLIVCEFKCVSPPLPNPEDVTDESEESI